MAQDTRREQEADVPEADPELGDRETEGSSEAGIEELEARCEELSAKWLRAQADYQNLRRRSLADLESSLKRHMQPLLDELLFVLDFLDMALASPAESQDATNLALGVQMTRTKLVQALEAAEVSEIPVAGTFDPEQHEAVESRHDPDADPGTILEVVRRGYTWQGRVLRAARVVVAAAEEDTGNADNDED